MFKKLARYHRISFLPYFDKDIITASVAVPAPCQIKAGELTDCLVVGFINLAIINWIGYAVCGFRNAVFCYRMDALHPVIVATFHFNV